MSIIKYKRKRGRGWGGGLLLLKKNIKINLSEHHKNISIVINADDTYETRFKQNEFYFIKFKHDCCIFTFYYSWNCLDKKE